MARTDAVLVDANVLLDVVTARQPWAGWSEDAMRQAARTGALWINDVVFAEVSVGFRVQAELDAVLDEVGMVLAPTPRAALFRAGKAFQAYRRRGGTRTGVLPDFFIGAHAEIEGLRLLTRDATRYRTYFPDLSLIAP